MEANTSEEGPARPTGPGGAVRQAFLAEHILEYAGAFWSYPFGDRTEGRVERFLMVASISLLWAAGLVGERKGLGAASVKFPDVDIHGSVLAITGVALFVVVYTFVMWAISARSDYKKWSIEIGNKKVPLFANARSAIQARRSAYDQELERIRNGPHALIEVLSKQYNTIRARELSLLFDDDEHQYSKTWVVDRERATAERQAVELELAQARKLLEFRPAVIARILADLADPSPSYLDAKISEFTPFEQFRFWAEVAGPLMVFLLTASVLVYGLRALRPG